MVKHGRHNTKRCKRVLLRIQLVLTTTFIRHLNRSRRAESFDILYVLFLLSKIFKEMNLKLPWMFTCKILGRIRSIQDKHHKAPQYISLYQYYCIFG